MTLDELKALHQRATADPNDYDADALNIVEDAALNLLPHLIAAVEAGKELKSAVEDQCDIWRKRDDLSDALAALDAAMGEQW